MKVNKKLSLLASSSTTFDPSPGGIAVSKWTITALGAGTAQINPIFDGIDTHESWTLNNSSIEVNLPNVSAWGIVIDGAGDADIFIAGV